MTSAVFVYNSFAINVLWTYHIRAKLIKPGWNIAFVFHKYWKNVWQNRKLKKTSLDILYKLSMHKSVKEKNLLCTTDSYRPVLSAI